MSTLEEAHQVEHVSPPLPSIPPEVWASWSEDERESYLERVAYMNEHKGHGEMHTTLLAIVIFLLAASQVVLLLWKRHHPKSFQAVSLVGLWLIPAVIAVRSDFWRYFVVWLAFTVANGYVMFRASRSPLDTLTPRLVYRWFSVVYHVSYFIGAIGYFMIVANFFGAGIVFVPLLSAFYSADDINVGIFQTGFLMLFYGLYFGVLGRDFAEWCSTQMASTIGYYSKEGFPKKHLRQGICAICGDGVEVTKVVQAGGASAAEPEKSHQLDCKHTFHDFCIRGWCLVGKKDMCPYCKEKVDLRKFSTNPWDKTHLLYAQFLDWLRYLLVWQPLIVFLTRIIAYFTGLK